MKHGSRRDFLKAASATAAALAITRTTPAWAAADPPFGAVKVWGTFRDQRHVARPSLEWKRATQIAADAIQLDMSAPRQQILGFGAAITEASAYVLSRLSDAERMPLMRDLFAPDALALNVCRTCIGASDYTTKAYSYDESTEPDPDLKKFSIDHDKEFYLPILREARKQNPEMFLFSSPWSPPGWMKPNNSMIGGAMRKLSFGPYANYFVKFLEAYKAEGVAIDAVTVQNETDAEQEGHMPACLFSQEQEMEFAARFLAPAIRKAGMNTKIWILDHNYSLWGRAIDELSDPSVYDAVDGIAWHGYVGEPTAMTRVHDAFPAKNAYWTEGGPDVNQPDYQTDYTKWADQYNGILNNWARSITAWNVALDEKGRPDIGPFSCGGVITIDNATHKVTMSGQYWAFAHYSKHVKRGAKVFATNGLGNPAETGVSHSGFSNPDGSCVVVIANKGAQKQVQLMTGTKTLDVDLPADSVQTLYWS
ncbi:glycoside hydrolase family 30 beta sandwich domain-containing protein [Telmatobacter sp. DSM 110680]|uniref:Glycoside hydrolase family 30 beta sandwich domain-containing protein n=1 Tax=Telmatobacter sp. DSM 110680 TaxID=3036704 RepID=A0AAU7DGQ0_9BACT